MTEKQSPVFGRPDEWDQFAKRHGLFLERFPNLKAAFDTAFLRRGKIDRSVDSVVFFLGRLCVEDFMEVLLLCANGYGIGGMKILRGMYERAVTAAYLHNHPERVEDFLDYYWVSNHKLAKAIKETFGSGALPEDERAKELEENFKRVRNRFMVTDCEQCGTKRLNYTWSKLDFVSMAKSVGALGKMIVPSYHIPTERGHSTAAAVVRLLREEKDGAITFEGGPQHDMADTALITAHNVLLQVLWWQKEHFGLDSLDAPLQKCFQDFKDIWSDGRDGFQGEVSGA
ncbi:MAG: DUF5677 domain-containing protein [Terriglobia bacterium]